ncbi:aspartic peptidase domain-containing protein [Lipomyces oligophaga]|uniref:aspartic peptidase domain-containing protein n=1 Tax=Lipomyces oligophaga TaxID=45792 RepID=UPI0034CFE515
MYANLFLLVSIALGLRVEAVFQLDLTLGNNGYESKSQHHIRETAIETEIQELQYMWYLAQISIGSESSRQTVYLAIDTDAGDTWILESGDEAETICTAARKTNTDMYCPVFNKSLSTTFQELTPFSASSPDYPTGGEPAAQGSYASDTLIIGSITIPEFEFGLASTADSPLGVLGLGMIFNEAAANTTGSYSNLPLRFRLANLTNVNAYSIWLNSLRSNAGSLLFGAIDQAKYKDELVITDIIPYFENEFRHPNVTVTGISVSWNGTYSTTVFNSLTASSEVVSSFYASLNPGLFASRFPQEIIQSLASTFGSTSFSNEYNMYTFLCSNVPLESILTIEINHVFNISVVTSDIFYVVSSVCVLAIQPTVGYSVLGQALLHSTYLVFDYDHYQIGLAEAVVNTEESSILILNDTGIPSGLVGVQASSASMSSSKASSTIQPLVISTTLDVVVVTTNSLGDSSTVILDVPVVATLTSSLLSGSSKTPEPTTQSPDFNSDNTESSAETLVTITPMADDLSSGNVVKSTSCKLTVHYFGVLFIFIVIMLVCV